MFHVERNLLDNIAKVIMVVLFLFFVVSSCGINKITTVISDYILITSNGKKILGSQNLVAFVFENNLKNLSIEEYLMKKYNLDNYQTRLFWVTINDDKYCIILYDKDETEKYFDLSDFSLINIEPDNIRKDGQSKFIAISIVNSYNEDCLASNSLYKNIVVNYLKKLKDEYYNY